MGTAGLPAPVQTIAIGADPAPQKGGEARGEPAQAEPARGNAERGEPTQGEQARGEQARGEQARRRGRPRSQQVDDAIICAATQLLAERGLGGMSIEEVASLAGVGKAAIYRRWPSRSALALDTFLAEFAAQQPSPDTGTLRGDLLATLHAWVQSVTQTSVGATLAGLIAETQRDPALAAAWRDRVVEPMRSQHAVMLDRAISRGEIRADTDKDTVLDLLFGAAYHRLLHDRRPPSDDFVRSVVHLLTAGLAAPRDCAAQG